MKTNAKYGSSLLETLIYAAILTIVAILTTNSILAMARAYGNIKLARTINFSAAPSMERMAREIRTANGIDGAGSVFGISPGKLKLNTLDNLGASTTIEFSLVGSAIYIKEGASSAEALTASSTSITGMVFNKITASSTSKAIKIKLIAKAVNGNMEKTENFYNTAILRGSY